MAHFTTTDGVRIYYEEHGSGGRPACSPTASAATRGMWRAQRRRRCPRGTGSSSGSRAATRARTAPTDPTQVTFGHWVAGPPRSHRPSGARRARWWAGSPLGGGHRHPLRAGAPGAGAGPDRGGLVLGGRASAQRGQRGDAGAEHRGDARGRDGRHGRVRHRLQPERGGPAQAGPRAREEVFAILPDAHAGRLRQRPAAPRSRWTTSPSACRRSPRPTLLVCGDEDPSLGPMRVMAEKIKHARFELLSPAGHFANRDQPEAFNRASPDFLARVDG